MLNQDDAEREKLERQRERDRKSIISHPINQKLRNLEGYILLQERGQSYGLYL